MEGLQLLARVTVETCALHHVTAAKALFFRLPPFDITTSALHRTIRQNIYKHSIIPDYNIYTTTTTTTQTLYKYTELRAFTASPQWPTNTHKQASS